MRGIIAFVGLIIPLCFGLFWGRLTVCCCLLRQLGGALLIAGFPIWGARTLIPVSDLPIGIFTALVGGPTFFFLLRRSMGKGGLLMLIVDGGVAVGGWAVHLRGCLF